MRFDKDLLVAELERKKAELEEEITKIEAKIDSDPWPELKKKLNKASDATEAQRILYEDTRQRRGDTTSNHKHMIAAIDGELKLLSLTTDDKVTVPTKSNLAWLLGAGRYIY